MGRWRQKAPKTRFECKTLYFARKSSRGISEPGTTWGVLHGHGAPEQAQSVVGGSKSAPWRCGLFIVLVVQGQQPSHTTPVLCTCTAGRWLDVDIFYNFSYRSNSQIILIISVAPRAGHGIIADRHQASQGAAQYYIGNSTYDAHG
jgi:hypothetical protein